MVTVREKADAAAAATLADEGHLLSVWRRSVPDGTTIAVGLYRTDTRAQLDALSCRLATGCTSPSLRFSLIPTTRQVRASRPLASRTRP